MKFGSSKTLPGMRMQKNAKGQLVTAKKPANPKVKGKPKLGGVKMRPFYGN